MAKSLAGRFIGIVLLVCCAVVLTVVFSQAEKPGMHRIAIRLPGTQPGHVAPADSFRTCMPCHQSQVGPRPTNIGRDWLGSTMAHAPKDPVFNAMLSITTNRTLGFGIDVPEFCLRCHSPSGWLDARSHELSVQALYGTDLDGVHCDFCHRATDPMSPAPGASIAGDVTGYGNGMYVVMPTSEPRRGSRTDAAAPHPTYREPFLKTGEFCGTCHEVSNPYLSSAPFTTPPHLMMPLERTYSEWKMSWYASQGENGSCQSCHMSKTVGYASSMDGARKRLDVAQHDFTGANTFLPDVIGTFWDGIDEGALRDARIRAQAMLQRAARLELAAGKSGGEVAAHVRVTNRTGHKLFTGFPEGRRVWLHVVGKDGSGNVLFESGRIDPGTRALVRDPQVKVYEAKPGITTAMAAYWGTPSGPSYHMALSDTIYFDNRIPPRGYRLDAFQERRAEPVGYDYADGQYWDESHYAMPTGVQWVEVSLMYQLVTKEFAEFLRDENVGNPYDWNNWGQRVYDAWIAKGDPVVMATMSARVEESAPRLPEFHDDEVPVEFVLGQNFPNPFNSGTTIEFWISTPGVVDLSIYDVLGRRVAQLSDDALPAGLHSRRLESSTLASGVYLYRLSVDGVSQTKKMLVAK
jgi:hypothetical protein